MTTTGAARMGHDPTVSLQVYAHSHDDAQDAAAATESLLTGTRPPFRVVAEPEPDSCDHYRDHNALNEDASNL